MGAGQRDEERATRSRNPEALERRRTTARVVMAVLVLGLLGATLGAWWSARQADVKEATAVVLLHPLQGNPFSPDARGDDLVNLETEAQLVTSDRVLEQLSSALPGQGVVRSEDVTVTVPTNTQLLSISVRAPSEAEAEAATQQLATLYLAQRRSRTESALADLRSNIDAQIQERQQERADLLVRLDDLRPGSPDSSLLEQQILAVATQVDELRTQLGEVGSVSLDPGQLVTPARASSGALPTGDPWVGGGLGLLLGATCGLVLATQLRGRGDLVRSRDDLAVLDVPCWASLPSDPDPVAAAKLRAVLLAPQRHPEAVVLVCRSGPGTSSISAPPLAESLAAARLRTVLVDLVGPGTDGQHRTGPAGLTEVLRDLATLQSALSWDGDLGRLEVGRDSDLLDNLAAAPDMDVVILGLRDLAHVVLMQSGSPTSPRTQALVSASDVVVLEVPVGRVSIATLERDVAELTTAGAKRIGIVLVAPPSRRRAEAAAPTTDVHPDGLRTRRQAVSEMPAPTTHDALILAPRQVARLGLRRTVARAAARTRGPA